MSLGKNRKYCNMGEMQILPSNTKCLSLNALEEMTRSELEDGSALRERWRHIIIIER